MLGLGELRQRVHSPHQPERSCKRAPQAASQFVRFIVDGDWRLRRQCEEHHLGVVESEPKPDVAPRDSSHPRAAHGLFYGLEVRRTGKLIGRAKRVDGAGDCQ
jgi:hypothetical protein